MALHLYDTEQYEMTSRGHNKFWHVSKGHDQNTGFYYVIVEFGAIGTQGQKREKKFSSKIQMDSYYQNKVQEKTKKGYQKVGGQQNIVQCDRCYYYDHEYEDAPQKVKDKLNEVNESLFKSDGKALFWGLFVFHNDDRVRAELNQDFNNNVWIFYDDEDKIIPTKNLSRGDKESLKQLGLYEKKELAEAVIRYEDERIWLQRKENYPKNAVVLESLMGDF